MIQYTNPQEQKHYLDYVARCTEYNTESLSFESWLKTTSFEDQRYFQYVDKQKSLGDEFLGHPEYAEKNRELALEERTNPDYSRYLSKCRNYGVTPLSEAEYWDSNDDEHDRYFDYVDSAEGAPVDSHSEWIRADRAAKQPEIQIANMLDLNTLYYDYIHGEESLTAMSFEEWHTLNTFPLVCYENHLKICQADNTPFISFEEWKLFDKEYLEHVKTASPPMTPSKYQREVWQKASQTIPAPTFSVQQLEAEILDLNQELKATLKVNEQLTVKLSNAEQLVADLRIDLDRWRAANNTLNEEVKATRKAADSNAQLFQECDKQRVAAEQDNLALQEEVLRLQKRIEEVQENNRSLYDEVDQMSRGRGEHIHKLTREVESLNKTILERTGERDRMASSLQAVCESRDSYFHQKENMSEEVTRLRRQIEDLRDENYDSNKEIELLRNTSVSTRTPPANQPEFPHYFREVPETTSHIDVYWILKNFEVTDPAIAHGIKKMLAAGRRGAKNAEKDLREARNSITRALELL